MVASPEKNGQETIYTTLKRNSSRYKYTKYNTRVIKKNKRR